MLEESTMWYQHYEQHKLNNTYFLSCFDLAMLSKIRQDFFKVKTCFLHILLLHCKCSICLLVEICLCDIAKYKHTWIKDTQVFSYYTVLCHHGWTWTTWDCNWFPMKPDQWVTDQNPLKCGRYWCCILSYIMLGTHGNLQEFYFQSFCCQTWNTICQ